MRSRPTASLPDPADLAGPTSPGLTADQPAPSEPTPPPRPPARWAGGWPEALLVGLGLTIWSLGARGFSGARWSDVPIIKSFVDDRLYRQDPFIWALHDGTPASLAAFVETARSGKPAGVSPTMAADVAGAGLMCVEALAGGRVVPDRDVFGDAA